ncbi:universal stress protein [Arthrobacter globiformis]|uniref:Universal stress protein n=1 Tax=Arthrobacter globiformis TaxID=1665 RepID=A0A328HDE9_ARTGO|nr:universal stress protein [Arthrobacter globiformis]RAM35415.1 universal stress protein [Arthrobacter globiformis]
MGDPFDRDEGSAWTRGPLIVGVPWAPPQRLIARASELADGLDVHLVCAFVDPSGYLAEFDAASTRTAGSIDPQPNLESLFPAAEVRSVLEAVLGSPGETWSLRVLNGAVPEALARLGDSIGASAIVVGGPRYGARASFSRLLEPSVSARLTRIQRRLVIVVPALTASSRP